MHEHGSIVLQELAHSSPFLAHAKKNNDDPGHMGEAPFQSSAVKCSRRTSVASPAAKDHVRQVGLVDDEEEDEAVALGKAGTGGYAKGVG